MRLLPSLLIGSTLLCASLHAHATSAIITTNHGKITIDLDEKAAPVTVANFVRYARAGFFSNTIFHRVIQNFMIQGGGFDTKLRQKPTRAPIDNEAANGLTNERYTIAMACTMVINSATSQFFINTADNGFLNWRDDSAQGYGYAVFGKVTKGFEVVDKIAAVAVEPALMSEALPLKPVVIRSVKIVK